MKSFIFKGEKSDYLMGPDLVLVMQSPSLTTCCGSRGRSMIRNSWQPVKDKSRQGVCRYPSPSLPVPVARQNFSKRDHGVTIDRTTYLGGIADPSHFH